jgi:hypothetical protein
MTWIAALGTAFLLTFVCAERQASAQSRSTGAGGSGPQCLLDSFRNQSVAVAPGTSSAESMNERLRQLAAQRARWRSQQPASYRLCRITLNELLTTITEVDVLQGKVRIARHAEMTAVERRAASGEWSPDAGVTVDDLFDQIQRELARPEVLSDKDGLRFVVEPSYDPQWGYPMRIYSGPDRSAAMFVFDADVLTLVRITPSPTVPLQPVSAGEVYTTSKHGRITNPGLAYDALLGFIFKDIDDRIRSLWPAQAAAILKRGNLMYWDAVKWQPKAGMVGNILGTFKHPDGRSVYLMAFSHNGEDIYCPIGTEAVTLMK